MSNAPLSSDSAAIEESSTTTRRFITPLRAAGQALGFWTAVLTPFLYLPLLTQLSTTQELLAFLLLFLINVGGLLAGRNYRRE